MLFDIVNAVADEFFIDRSSGNRRRFQIHLRTERLPHTFPLAGLLTPGENTLTLTLTGSPANRYGKHPVPYGLER